MTHIYIPEITKEGIPPRMFSSFRDSYEYVFLQVFKGLASKLRGTVSARRDVLALRAMHRKSGLKMFDTDGQLVASLKSEYRGSFVEDNKSAVHDSLRRQPLPDEIYGVFVLEEAGQNELSKLMVTVEEEGLRLHFNQTELELSLDNGVKVGRLAFRPQTGREQGSQREPDVEDYRTCEVMQRLHIKSPIGTASSTLMPINPRSSSTWFHWLMAIAELGHDIEVCRLMTSGVGLARS
jgi:hypothetical protein